MNSIFKVSEAIAFEAKQLRGVAPSSPPPPPPPLALSHLSYIPQVSFLGTETIYFMLSSVCFVWKSSHSVLVWFLLKRNIISAILWNPFFLIPLCGRRIKKKKNYLLLQYIITSSRCTNHEQNFAVYFCNVLRVCASLVHLWLNVVVLLVYLWGCFCKSDLVASVLDRKKRFPVF